MACWLLAAGWGVYLLLKRPFGLQESKAVHAAIRSEGGGTELSKSDP